MPCPALQALVGIECKSECVHGQRSVAAAQYSCATDKKAVCAHKRWEAMVAPGLEATPCRSTYNM